MPSSSSSQASAVPAPFTLPSTMYTVVSRSARMMPVSWRGTWPGNAVSARCTNALVPMLT